MMKPSHHIETGFALPVEEDHVVEKPRRGLRIHAGLCEIALQRAFQLCDQLIEISHTESIFALLRINIGLSAEIGGRHRDKDRADLLQD